MDNILGFLIIVGGVIYKIYSEYAKEQQKAAKRNPKKPVAQQAPVKERPLPTPNPQPTPVVTHKPVEAPKAPVLQREINKSLTSKKPTPVIIKRNDTEQDIPEEVLRVRRLKEENDKKSNKKFELQYLSEDQHEGLHFDLKEAIIQEAILRRPSY